MSSTSALSSSTSFSGRDILVTGGNGYIGSHTVLHLLNAGANVTIVDNLVNSSVSCKERIEKLSGKEITFHVVSLCDPHGLLNVFHHQKHSRGKPFDSVIHFAGLKAVGESVAKPLEYYDNNVGGTVVLLKLMKEFSCKSIVFSSSATVYGLTTHCPIDESFPLHPTNPYGNTKFHIEEILRDVAKSDAQFTAVILRYFNPIGAHPSGDIGESPNGIPNNLLPFVLQVAVGRRTEVNIFGNDWETEDGTGVRDYIHVDDLARGHLSALSEGIFHRLLNNDKGRELSNCESYNLGTGRGVSVLQLIQSVERATGKEIKYQFVKRRDGDVATSYADATKAQRVLKWKSIVSLDESIASSWKWQKQNPMGYPESKAPTVTPPSSLTTASPKGPRPSSPNQQGFLALPTSSSSSSSSSISFSPSSPSPGSPPRSSSMGKPPPLGMLPPSPSSAAFALAKSRGSTAPPPAIAADQAFHQAIDGVTMKRGEKENK